MKKDLDYRTDCAGACWCLCGVYPQCKWRPGGAQPQVTAQPAQTEAPQAGGEALDGALVEPLSEDGQNATDAQQEVFTLTGQITEVGEDYLILEDAQQGQVHVNFAEDTVYEGIEQNALAVGQYAVVLYNGVMTLSRRPMVTACGSACTRSAAPLPRYRRMGGCSSTVPT